MKINALTSRAAVYSAPTRTHHGHRDIRAPAEARPPRSAVPRAARPVTGVRAPGPAGTASGPGTGARPGPLADGVPGTVPGILTTPVGGALTGGCAASFIGLAQRRGASAPLPPRGPRSFCPWP